MKYLDFLIYFLVEVLNLNDDKINVIIIGIK